jgi:hypothetical protein
MRLLFGLLRRIVSLFFPAMRVEGLEPGMGERASIFVANHAGSFGPLAMSLRFPLRLYPWVLGEVTERGSCARYVEADFVRAELGLGRPLSRGISLAIELVCVPMMRYLEAIPVFRGSRRLERTFERSRDYLLSGRSLLIFPEMIDEAYNEELNRLDLGFLEILGRAHLSSAKPIEIYPAYVDRKRRRIRVGPAVAFDLGAGLKSERRRIEGILEAEMTRLALAP